MSHLHPLNSLLSYPGSVLLHFCSFFNSSYHLLLRTLVPEKWEEMQLETIPMLKVLVLKFRCIIPNILQCPKDTALSKWLYYWFSLMNCMKLFGKKSLHLGAHILYIWNPFHGYNSMLLNCQQNAEIVYLANTSPSWKVFSVTSVILPCHIFFFGFFFSVRSELISPIFFYEQLSYSSFLPRVIPFMMLVPYSKL